MKGVVCIAYNKNNGVCSLDCEHSKLHTPSTHVTQKLRAVAS